MLLNEAIKIKIKKIWRKVDDENHLRLAKEILPDDIAINVYSYKNDKSKWHKLNLYTPKNLQNKKLPLIIDIHGGGWLSGDKDLNSNFCCTLAQYGYKVASMSYHLCTHVNLARQIQDVYASIHYLINNADLFNIDINKVYLTGDSSGGMLALYIDTINKNKYLQDIVKVQPFNISFKAIAVNHAVPFTKELNFIDGHPFVLKLAQNALYSILTRGKHTKLYKNFSIEDYINNASFPPLFVISSAGDTAFLYQTKKLCILLKEKGFYYESLISDNIDLKHVYNVSFPNTIDGKKTNKEIIKFFKKFSE